MRIKIRGGTANSGDPSLCLTCRFATVVKGQRLREEIVECGRCPTTQNHTPCHFLHPLWVQRHASIREMEEIACAGIRGATTSDS